VRAIPAVPDRGTRDLLAEALDRLVGAKPGYVEDLLAAEDPMLAAEAARIVGRIGLTEAEADLVELSKRPEEVTRQAAIEALAALGSDAGAQVLARALTDPGKEIRMAAVQAVQAVRPAGLEQLLGRIIDSEVPGRDQAEQMAFLRTYATLAGEDAVPRLSRILNGRRWWGGRRPPTLRACAARALALVGSSGARAALEKAADDRAAAVKSSVRVSLKAIDADSDQRLAVASPEQAEPAVEPISDPVQLRKVDSSEGGRETEGPS